MAAGYAAAATALLQCMPNDQVAWYAEEAVSIAAQADDAFTNVAVAVEQHDGGVDDSSFVSCVAHSIVRAFRSDIEVAKKKSKGVG